MTDHALDPGEHDMTDHTDLLARLDKPGRVDRIGSDMAVLCADAAAALRAETERADALMAERDDTRTINESDEPRGLRPAAEPKGAPILASLAAQMRANSERWFPATHDPDKRDMPLDVFYALGLSGEVGEVANDIKKMHRDEDWADSAASVPAELADVFVYLMLLADELGVDLVAEYQRKVAVNEQRWAQP
jgi:NTP pyrophosphatase (non-canonical NTP hydrolase)